MGLVNSKFFLKMYLFGCMIKEEMQNAECRMMVCLTALIFKLCAKHTPQFCILNSAFVIISLKGESKC